MSTCPKCAGCLMRASARMMLTDYMIDACDVQTGHGVAVRCINCGFFADAVMVANLARTNPSVLENVHVGA